MRAVAATGAIDMENIRPAMNREEEVQRLVTEV